MSRATVILNGQAARNRVASWAMTAPINTRVEFKESRRTLPQSARMWAHLTDIARQHRWNGIRLTAEDYKILFLSALKSELRLVPNIDGTGFVQLGRSSSDLSKGEMADLITLIERFAAERGIVLGDEVSEGSSEAGAPNKAPVTAQC